MKIWYEEETEQLHIDGQGRLVLLKDNDIGLKIDSYNFPDNLKLTIEGHGFYGIPTNFKGKIKAWWVVTKFIFKK